MLITANNADTQATVTFTGTATDHSVAADLSNTGLAFTSTAFTNTASIANVKGDGASKTDIAIDFIGAPTLTLGCRCSQFIIWQSN
ncbi:MAG: hypothetical protein FE834_00385 [Gammaproteobacteria bacterium]|nr:hypothetical protein [Gammaproteobacteria bacterium]